MKILLITQWFDPEPTFKGLLFAQELKKNGHEVEVVTGFPNYPGGKIYDGYKISLYKKEIIDGIVIHRVPLYPSHDSSAIKRILNYVSFSISSFFCGLLKTNNINIIYGYHPPLTTSLSVVLVGMLKRVPVIVDIQDLWPDTLSATGMVNNKKILFIVGKLCNFVYRHSAKIVVLSPGFKKHLILRGVNKDKVKVIYNWCNEPALNNFEESNISLPVNGKLNVLFAGNLGYAQGLPSIIDAAKLLQEKKVEVNIVMLGDGVDKNNAIKLVENKQLTNVFFLPRVPMKQVGALLSKADMLLVHLTDNELFEITIPSRTQASLAMAKPIVMGVKGDAADLVEKSGGGVVCQPGNPLSLANGIETLVKMSKQERLDIGQKAKEFYLNELSLSSGVKKFIQVFEEVL